MVEGNEDNQPPLDIHDDPGLLLPGRRRAAGDDEDEADSPVRGHKSQAQGHQATIELDENQRTNEQEDGSSRVVAPERSGEEDGSQEPEAARPRKQQEPFDVPTSGAFWLHDDRFDEYAGADNQKQIGGKGKPATEGRWTHDKFTTLDNGRDDDPRGNYWPGNQRGGDRSSGQRRSRAPRSARDGADQENGKARTDYLTSGSGHQQFTPPDRRLQGASPTYNGRGDRSGGSRAQPEARHQQAPSSDYPAPKAVLQATQRTSTGIIIANRNPASGAVSHAFAGTESRQSGGQDYNYREPRNRGDYRGEQQQPSYSNGLNSRGVPTSSIEPRGPSGNAGARRNAPSGDQGYDAQGVGPMYGNGGDYGGGVGRAEDLGSRSRRQARGPGPLEGPPSRMPGGQMNDGQRDSPGGRVLSATAPTFQPRQQADGDDPPPGMSSHLNAAAKTFEPLGASMTGRRTAARDYNRQGSPGGGPPPHGSGYQYQQAAYPYAPTGPPGNQYGNDHSYGAQQMLPPPQSASRYPGGPSMYTDAQGYMPPPDGQAGRGRSYAPEEGYPPRQQGPYVQPEMQQQQYAPPQQQQHSSGGLDGGLGSGGGGRRYAARSRGAVQ